MDDSTSVFILVQVLWISIFISTGSVSFSGIAEWQGRSSLILQETAIPFSKVLKSFTFLLYCISSCFTSSAVFDIFKLHFSVCLVIPYCDLMVFTFFAFLNLVLEQIRATKRVTVSASVVTILMELTQLFTILVTGKQPLVLTLGG